jgi:hypothetical protein
MGSPAKNKIEIDYRANKIASEKLRQLGISPNLMNVPCGAKTKISPDRRTVWVILSGDCGLSGNTWMANITGERAQPHKTQRDYLALFPGFLKTHFSAVVTDTLDDGSDLYVLSSSRGKDCLLACRGGLKDTVRTCITSVFGQDSATTGLCNGLRLTPSFPAKLADAHPDAAMQVSAKQVSKLAILQERAKATEVSAEITGRDVANLISLNTDILHQLETDLTLETVPGAVKYQVLRTELRKTLTRLNAIPAG